MNPTIKSAMDMWDRIKWALVSKTRMLVFLYLSFMSTKTHLHNYWRMKNKIQTLGAEEKYYGLTFSITKQYKTIDNKLATKHLLPE